MADFCEPSKKHSTQELSISCVSGFFAMKGKKARKSNLFVRFLGESMAHQSAFGII